MPSGTNQRYVNKKEDGTITANCPFCRGVIFRDFTIGNRSNSWSFLMRCPHCQRDVPVTFEDGIVTVGDANAADINAE